MTTLGEHVLFVHAHPDDETLSTGVAIVRVVHDGGRASVLTCTRGERGEVREVAAEQVRVYGLDAVRAGELQRAVSALGGAPYLLPGYSDSGMEWVTPERAGPAADAPANALSHVPAQVLADQIARVAADLGVTAIVSYDAQGGYGHPDHVRLHEACARASEMQDLPFWTIVPSGAPAAEGVVVVEAEGAERSAVLAALAAYPSQFEVRPVGEHIDIVHVGGQVERWSAMERFRRFVPEPVPTPRWASAVFAVIFAIAGLVAGAAGTLTHQSGPLALTIACIAVIALVLGARVGVGSRVAATAAALGAVLATWLLVFGPWQLAPFGSPLALMPDNLMSWLWLIVPPAASLVVLAWPTAEGIARIKRAADEGAPR